MSGHLLAVRQDNNGDVLLTGPALRSLRAGCSRLSLLCAPSGVAAAELLPEVDQVLVEQAEWIAGEPGPVTRPRVESFVDRIARADIDQAVIFTSFHQSPLPQALLLRMAGVPVIHAISVDYPGSLLDTRASVPDDVHEVQRNIALARAAGFPAQLDDALRLRPLPRVDELDLPASFIAVHPGATVAARAWAPAKNRDLVAALRARGTGVVVTGSAAETDLCAFVTGQSGALNLCGRTTFAQYCAVISAADALVVGNTAGAHVAAAVQTPVVSIFAPTIPAQRFRPWRTPHVLLGEQSIACAGCRAKTCPIPGQPCTGTVEIDDVMYALGTFAAVRDSEGVLAAGGSAA